MSSKSIIYTEVKRKYYIPSNRPLMNRLITYIELGDDMYKILLKHSSRLGKLPTGKYLKSARELVYTLPSFNSFPYKTIDTLLLTIRTYLKVVPIKGKNIYNWHIPLRLIPEAPKTPTTPILKYTQISFEKFDSNGIDMVCEIYEDREFTESTSIDIRAALKYGSVSITENNVIMVTLTLYTGTDKDGVLINIPKQNKVHQHLRTLSTTYWLYSALLHSKIQNMTYSSIVKNKSYKKLHKLLLNAIKDHSHRLNTINILIEQVCRDTYERIVELKRVPEIPITNCIGTYKIHIYDIQYRKIITDIGHITDIDSRIEALPYLDLENSIVVLDKDRVYLIIPNKSNLREVEIDYI